MRSKFVTGRRTRPRDLNKTQ